MQGLQERVCYYGDGDDVNRWMIRSGTVWGAALVLGVNCWSCTGHRQGQSNSPQTGRQHQTGLDIHESDRLRKAVRATMADARRAVDELGVTEAAMHRIQEALARLAREPGLKEGFTLRELHGGGASAAVLASEGDEGLTLTLARFEAGVRGAIHDHGTWAIAYVVEGQDQYIHWERVDDGCDPGHSRLRVNYQKVLGPGDFVYWFDPPHDIHSQQAMAEDTWELVLFGKNPVATARQYFDVDSGRITKRRPQ